ncbi:MAG: hypothetical protein IT208_08685 [Chthonomonadales bacterium]|nr:hypothetical protein [Chthonomonadales bacterium]
MLLNALAAAALAVALADRPAPPPTAVVEVEEEVYSYQPANNGAGPMWTLGNTCLVRLGDRVLVSGLETLPERKPLNNVRWTLFDRGASGWTLRRRGEGTHEREPCPLVGFADGRVFLSTNPNTSAPDQYDASATPRVLCFRAGRLDEGPVTETPAWDRPLNFHAHTYRSFAADARRREMIVLYNTAYDRVYWSLRDSRGRWSSQGSLAFPWGAEYEKPVPVRLCYPSVALRDRKVFFFGVSDIEEPNPAWRAYKKELTGKDWDYDFRRLFFTWSDDITKGAFHPWVEIATRDRTCGWLFPCDLHVAPDGAVHLLWAETAIDERLRQRFFPDAKQSRALNYAVVREGKVVLRKAVHEWKEGDLSDEKPGNGRFHLTPDGRLFVVYYVGGGVSENRVVEVRAGGTMGEPAKLALRKPLSSFYIATPRTGCAPSKLIDLLGDVDGTLRYARIRLR